MEETIKYYKCIIPKAVAKPVIYVPSTISCHSQKQNAYSRFAYQKLMSHRTVHTSLKHSSILFFPHKNLVQYDCGKLQRLAQLLKTLYLKGSKVLIFTQMTRMLDVLEQFLNLHGYSYVRLDGSVKVEAR
jgi:helicase SWR1